MKKVFINDEIFESDGDYVIGGFETEKKDNFEFADFYDALVSRLSRLIDEYLEQATIYNLRLGYYENAIEIAKDDLALVVFDYLKSDCGYNDKESVMDAILSHEKTQTWLLNLKDNIKNYPLYNIGTGIVNKSIDLDVYSEEYELAKQFTDSTFEEFIEQISTIEL
jgi:hypothetical protein